MKIRAGFVSNSSSSSFIFFGKTCNINDVKPSRLAEAEILVQIDYDAWGGEGDLIINIDKRMLAYLKKNPGLVALVWENFATIEEGGELDCDLSAGTEVISMNASYHCDQVNSLESLREAVEKK